MQFRPITDFEMRYSNESGVTECIRISHSEWVRVLRLTQWHTAVQ